MGSRLPPAAATISQDLAPASVLADFGRHQLATAVNSTCALLRGSESMRRIQLDAAHRTLGMYQQAAQQLQAGCSAQEMGAVQSELSRFDMQGMIQYWQQLASAMLQTQLDMLASLQTPGAEGKGQQS